MLPITTDLIFSVEVLLSMHFKPVQRKVFYHRKHNAAALRVEKQHRD